MYTKKISYFKYNQLKKSMKMSIPFFIAYVATIVKY